METIRQYAEVGDRKRLRYAFAGAFDADPTFERYEEDYQYCRDRGLLDPHRDLTPLTEDPASWTQDYWYQLVKDLRENLSDTRLNHMRKVARTVFAEKVARLKKERDSRIAKPEPQREPPAAPKPAAPFNAEAANAELERKARERIAESQRVYEETVRREDAQRKEDQRRREMGRRQAPQDAGEGEGSSGKKAMGAAALVAVILLALLLSFLILKQKINP